MSLIIFSQNKDIRNALPYFAIPQIGRVFIPRLEFYLYRFFLGGIGKMGHLYRFVIPEEFFANHLQLFKICFSQLLLFRVSRFDPIERVQTPPELANLPDLLIHLSCIVGIRMGVDQRGRQKSICLINQFTGIVGWGLLNFLEADDNCRAGPHANPILPDPVASSWLLRHFPLNTFSFYPSCHVHTPMILQN